jgi:hypothetical protein
MNPRLVSLLLPCLLLSACSMLKLQLPQAKPVLPENPLLEAEQLASDKRWGEAVHLLEQAVAQGYDDTAYLDALAETTRQQKVYEDELRARLLLEETKAVQNQLPILEKLAHSEPQNPQLSERLTSARNQLTLDRKTLSTCGWSQAARDNQLARQCLELALSIEDDPQDRRLLERLTEKKVQTIKREVQKQRGIREKQWKDRNQGRLHQARQHFQDGQLDESRKQLRRLLQEDPHNQEARQLLSQVEKLLEIHMDNLLKAGDRMYREGEIEGAKALWQAASKMDPDDIRATEKIERADRVLKNLESLRKSN